LEKNIITKCVCGSDYLSQTSSKSVQYACKAKAINLAWHGQNTGRKLGWT